MAAAVSPPKELRLLSLVEALTVTGPVKPILIFSELMRSGFGGVSNFSHTFVTTRRPRPQTSSQDELCTAAKQVGAEFIALPERRPFDLAVLPELRRTVHELRPHIVETHGSKSHLLFYIARASDLRMKRVTWIAFHHGYTRTSWRVRAYQQIDRLTLRRADRVVTMCKPFATMLTARGVRPGNISVIANTTAPRAPPSREAVAQARAALRLTDNETVILSVGRLSREKGHGDLIAALVPIAGNYLQKIRLVIVGEGPERGDLERLAAPIASNVVFAGHVSDPWPMYHLAQMFVLPSHSEGSPLVILEAMAAGLPIIATAVGGIPEILTNRRSALLVPPGRPQALASAIAELLKDEPLRIQVVTEASRALIRCSPAAYAQRLLSIYESEMANRQT